MKKLVILFSIYHSLWATFPKEYYEIKDVSKMKESFFHRILHMAKIENANIILDRYFIINTYPKLHMIDKNSLVYKRFEKIRQKYKIKDNAVLKEYLNVIDTVPNSLILAQAAIESGWGKSRFFKEANNIFGQWTWTGKGLTPANRDAGKKHKIKIFDSLQDALKGYLRNINIGWAYKEFRLLRAESRQKNIPLTGISLSPTLINYSQKKEEYTNLLKRFIVSNNLSKYDI